MKKQLASQLKLIAAQLPEKWEKDFETVQMSGAEANLCYVGSKRPHAPDRIIEFNAPRFVQINHYTRLKEGVKKEGLPFVGKYIARFSHDNNRI